MLMFGLKGRRKVADVQAFDGPTSAGGASLNVYTFDDASLETVEYDWSGRELVRYAGEPRAVPPGVRMPDPPPRPKGAAPLPPGMSYPPPRPPAAPAAPLEPPSQQHAPQPVRRSSS
jgi:hypothetical protein